MDQGKNMEQFIYKTKFYENYKTYDPNLMDKIKKLETVDDVIYCLEELIKYQISDNFLKYFLAEVFQLFGHDVIIEKIKTLNETIYDIVSNVDIYRFYDKFNGNFTIDDIFKFFNKKMIIEYNTGPIIREYLRENYFDDFLCYLKQCKFDKSINTYTREYENHIFKNEHVLKFFIKNDNYYFFYPGTENINKIHIELNPGLICNETYDVFISNKTNFMIYCIINDKFDIIQICNSLDFTQNELNDIFRTIISSSNFIKIKYIEFLLELYIKFDINLNTEIDMVDKFLLKFLKSFLKSVDAFKIFLNEFKNKESFFTSKENEKKWDNCFSKYLKLDKNDVESRLDFLFFCQECDYIDIYKKYEKDYTIFDHIPEYTKDLDLPFNANFLNEFEILKKYFDFENFIKNLVEKDTNPFRKDMIDYLSSIPSNIYDFKKNEDYYLNIYYMRFNFIKFLMEKNIDFRKNNNEYLYSLLNKEKTIKLYINRAYFVYESIIIFFLKNIFYDVKIDLSIVNNDYLRKSTIDYINNHNEKL